MKSADSQEMPEYVTVPFGALLIIIAGGNCTHEIPI